jgi:hypothetical protein
VATLPFGETSAIQCNWVSHRATAVSGPPGGVSFPVHFVSGHVLIILRLPFFDYILLGVIKTLIQLKLCFVLFSLAGIQSRKYMRNGLFGIFTCFMS